MSDSGKAVFLSYASQDAEAAKRICDALRAASVMVWFDADGGLEHGDEWDRKIRGQIKECVLFLPVISANTQARHEGYFRIEWELAAERAMGIAAGVPFILPIVIDDTRESDALVPDRFRKVQWTKLRDGAVPPEVLARFLKLWSHRTGVLSHEAGRAGGADQISSTAPSGKAAGGAGAKNYALITAVAVIVLAGAGWWVFQHRSPAPVSAAAPASAAGEAEQLLRQARELVYDPDSGRNEFALAENLLKRATDLAPTSGAAWGASALLNHYFYSRAYDTSRQRLVRSQAEAEKALRLDPRNTDALLALGLHHQVLGDSDRAQDYLERARASDPRNSKVILAQSLQLPDHPARAKFLLEEAARMPQPAEIFYYASVELTWTGRYDEAMAACKRAIAVQPFWRTFVQCAAVEQVQTADPAKMTAWLDKVPELKRDEPRVGVMRYEVAMLRRDGATAVRVLTGLATDYLEDNFFTGPKAYLLAQAHEAAGQPERAAEQWLLAERTVREKLAADPGEIWWRALLAVILTGQHHPAEAKTVADGCAADERLKLNAFATEETAVAFTRLGELARAIALLRTLPNTDTRAGYVSAATLAADPRWDALRGQPAYAQLTEELKRSENVGSGEPRQRPAPNTGDRK